jgi:hypothetical protein
MVNGNGTRLPMVLSQPSAEKGCTMQTLDLAIRISEIAEEAAATGKPVDVHDVACRLIWTYPEVHVTEAQVEQALDQEIEASAWRQYKVMPSPRPGADRGSRRRSAS